MSNEDSQARKLLPEEYPLLFGTAALDKNKLRAAFEIALDNRKFEIDLYWKRATYFWTLIAAAFAGFFAIRVSSPRDIGGIAYLLACIGFTFTFAWLQANRGSKQASDQAFRDFVGDLDCIGLREHVFYGLLKTFQFKN